MAVLATMLCTGIESRYWKIKMLRYFCFKEGPGYGTGPNIPEDEVTVYIGL